MKLSGLLFAAALLGSCTQPAAEENYTRHVDPKIGTGGHGHVFVGANVPFGLVQVGPTVRGRSRNPVITRFRLCATALRPS